MWKRQLKLGLCARAKFKKLSPILTACCTSYIKGKMYTACVQNALTYWTETWAMKVGNLHSLERTKRMMVRWMCGVSLKDRKMLDPAVENDFEVTIEVFLNSAEMVRGAEDLSDCEGMYFGRNSVRYKGCW